MNQKDDIIDYVAECSKTKTVADSITTQTHILMPEHINGQSRMFGGRIMQWMDIVAAVVARRHSGKQVTTACVDSLDFLAPAYVNETLIISGRMVYVGNTSMEVRVEAFTEDFSGKLKPITSAHFVMVAIDESGEPERVPRLRLYSEREKAEFEKGKYRAQLRKQRKSQC